MSTNSFKSNYPNSKKTIRVQDQPGGVHVAISGHAYESLSLDPADAPAFALAILEAAPGPEHVRDGSPEAMLAIAHGMLRRAVDAFASDAESKAKETADREALEGEAMDFYRAGIEPGVSDWNLIPAAAQEMWLRVARHARELRGGTK